MDQFQSTHPHGVRREEVSYRGNTGGFNPRTHTGCDLVLAQLGATYMGFNPRTHTGCDLLLVHSKCRAIVVSIHAPTRGATDDLEELVLAWAFQSTHPHGVRQKKRNACKTYLTFQSTHPHGVRPNQVSKSDEVILVSIHAPTRGATTGVCTGKSIGMFQSTHPHGVRPAYVIG